MTVVAGAAGVLALAACGGSRSLSLPCAPKPTGALCIKVFHDGRTVKDAVAYLSASESPLDHRTWRLVLNRYACDPGSRPRPSCRTAATYPGSARQGNPPVSVYCRKVSGTEAMVITTPSGCHDTLAQALASFGDFAGFTAPKSFSSPGWLCVSEQLRVNGSWRQASGDLAPTPLRACAAVSA